MNKTGLIAALVFGMLVAFGAGVWVAGNRGASATANGRKILYYVDPMNPAHTSEKPGLAPCGMKMEPVYADEAGAPGAGQSLASMPPGTVRITPEKQQLIGLRVEEAEKKKVTQTLRLLGRVAPDETRVFRINATVDGWITEAMPFATGSFVKKNETLATFYSPEFLSAGQALLFALTSQDRVQNAAITSAVQSNQVAQFNINIQQYKDSLRNLGMGNSQIEEMLRTRKFQERVNIASPTEGILGARNISQGQRFDKGTELFRVLDLSRVWILAEVFERDAQFIKPGVEVKVILPNSGQALKATLSHSLPQFDNVSRTLKLRLETDNPGYMLKPDMFVDVEVPVSLPESLVLPADAVLDSGARKTVYVDHGNGFFEPRVVQSGWRFGDQIEIKEGIMAGESVVVSGNFLVDSESRMKLAAAGKQPASAARDPVCGMVVYEKNKAKAPSAEHEGKTYYFCCAGCKDQFVKDPKQFLGSSEKHQ